MLTFYFATNWAPKYIADVTHNPLTAANLMSSFSVGGLIGVFVFAVVTAKSSIKTLCWMTAAVVVLAGAGVAWFGHAATVGAHPNLIFGAASFMLAAGTAGFYTITPRLYPEKVRATGYGVVIGVGRIGGIIAPTAGGWFFGGSTDPESIFLIFAVPMAVSMAITLVLMRFRSDKTVITAKAAPVAA